MSGTRKKRFDRLLTTPVTQGVFDDFQSLASFDRAYVTDLVRAALEQYLRNRQSSVEQARKLYPQIERKITEL